MSRELGFSNAVFSQWKKRKQNPSAESLRKMAEYFQVSVDYLLGYETEKEIIPGRLKIISVDDPNADHYKITLDAEDEDAFLFGLQILQNAGDFSEEARQELLNYLDYMRSKQKPSKEDTNDDGQT